MKILKHNIITNRKDEKERHLYLKLPPSYQHFTQKDIFSFNDNCIKPKELAICGKNRAGDVYVHVFDLPKKKPLKKRVFIEESEKFVERLLRRWKGLNGKT